jgi:hypothetical protein
MGWVEQRGNKFRLSFRYGGKLYRHYLGVDNQKQADESLSLVERNLRLLEEGILDLPRGADLSLFLLSGGRLTAQSLSHKGVRPLCGSRTQGPLRRAGVGGASTGSWPV